MGVKLKGLQGRLDRIPEHVKQMVRMKNNYEEKLQDLNKIIEAQQELIDLFEENHYYRDDSLDRELCELSITVAKLKHDYLNKTLFEK